MIRRRLQLQLRFLDVQLVAEDAVQRDDLLDVFSGIGDLRCSERALKPSAVVEFRRRSCIL